ncbi:MAG: STAS domain-containing protein [Deltaproteobacteria bacterium]|nr:STAS domain-containing protein [Deltaproteobacteria bacterium]
MTLDNKGNDSARDERQRLRDRIADLELSLKRTTEGLQFQQMIMKTFTSLALTDKGAICDTIISLVASHLEVAHGGAMLLDMESGSVVVAGQQGFSQPRELDGAGAGRLWASVMEERIARIIPGAEVARLWPGRPQALAGGVAAVAIDVRERTVGLLFVAQKRSGDDFVAEDLHFMNTASGIAAMALTSAEAITAQQELFRDVETQAAQAQREAQEKEKALKELDQKLEIIGRQQLAIQELSTPILQLWDNVLALPVIGVVDSKRSADIMERLLSEITIKQSRFVILDITGVEVVDTKTADHFIKVIKAAELLGTRCILTGIRPAVAQTLVEIGVDLSSIITLRNLQDGLRECLRQMAEHEEAARAVR